MLRKLWMGLALVGVVVGAELKEELAEHAGTEFRVVRLDPRDLELVWKGADGGRLATFSAVQEHFAKQGKSLTFLMNAGIFEPGGVPSGLHVEDGRTLHPLNLEKGEGNFFLKPNGVFSIDRDGKARVMESARYAASPPDQVVTALQSGPLLLAEGKRHPAFREGSDSRKHRNGVGVDGRGRVVFAITVKGGEVNLWDFGGLFLKLGCRDDLFLDGDISEMAVNPQGGVESNRFGAMLVVTEGGAAANPAANPATGPATATLPGQLEPDALDGFKELAPGRKRIVGEALKVRREHTLGEYIFGSADPARGGFDCSGAVYHVLRAAGLDPPRTSSQQFEWVKKGGGLVEPGAEVDSLDDPAFAKLKSGDLLFWSGTYQASDGRTNGITHVQIFLGREKDGRLVMIGSTDGRSYRGTKRRGYGVFDFKLPSDRSKSRFAGYGPPQGLAGVAAGN